MAARLAIRCPSAFGTLQVRSTPSNPLIVLRSSYSIQSHGRHYHTPSSPPPPPFSSTESAILSAAMAHVPEHGFSDVAITRGAQDASYLPASAAIFPNGAFDLVRFHLVTRRLALGSEVQFAEQEGPEGSGAERLGVGGKVRALVLARLRANEVVIHRWQEALALSAHPSNAPTLLSELFALSDEIWHLSGDRSVDFSWYTRRGSLAAVYATSELFQTTDTSSNFRETEAFVDRRLEEVKEVGGMLAAAGEWAAFSARGLVNVARSKGMRI